MALTRRQLSLSLALSPVLGLWPRVGHARAPRVLIVGDSLIVGGFGPALEAELEQRYSFAVDRRGKVASGLARPDFYDWFEVGPEARAEFLPDAVIVMFGGNDRQGLYMGEGADPEWIRYGSEGWEPEYRRRINAFANAMTPAGEGLIWVGIPQMRSAKLCAHVAYVNRLVRAELAIRPSARFVDVWTVLAEDGGFTEQLEIDGQRERVRTGDGIHITRAGGRVLAEYVHPRVASLLTRRKGG
ncbi:hypothetical protein ENSA5_40700 [Enhygromyxa salina]|uniref:Uncharacterized protein n=1 Tax=Enhygromyxa salina TaxID=215803 RepID=A0A2S9XPF2_9BACT|nr:hypothetical protein ENSA5_40700 [Enhygromyxa salina]